MNFTKQLNKGLLLNKLQMATMNDFFWHFGERHGGADIADNIDAKFFTERYASLVRESLQNSLDAQADKNKPVVVKYSFGKMEIPSDSKFFDVEKYIAGCLSLHKQDKNDRVYKSYTPMLGFIKEARKNGSVSFLEVSDFNTVGMDYDEDEEKCTKTRFYSFAKSIGNSAKDNDTRGGSYGLGKAVFYKNSSLRTILISTKTNCSTAFEGIASLCTSKVDGTKREATGYFCDNEYEKPTIEESKIPVFFRRQECGTSIYIMGVNNTQENQKSCYDEIKKAIAFHFWLSILHKKLIVYVGEDMIDDKNIIDIASELYQGQDEKSPIPYIETVLYAEDGGINDYIMKEEIVQHLGKCRLYIHKDRKGPGIVLNMRGTEMLIFQQHRIKGLGFYGIFLCLGDEGNKKLRMAEDPAHQTWNSNNCENENDRTLAREAITAKNRFIDKWIKEIFVDINENTTSISDLQNYLYMTVSEQELEESRNSVYGIHSGTQQTELSKFKIPDLSPNNLPVGDAGSARQQNVYIVEQCTNTTEEEEGELEGGNGEGGGGGSKPHIIPVKDNRFTDNGKGEHSGSFLRPIRLKAYAVYTKKVADSLYHFLRIVPECNCDNLILDVFAVGDVEDQNDEIFIESVSPGLLEGHNRIKGLSVKQNERLEVRIKFEDNMSHPITIMAYEIKKIK